MQNPRVAHSGNSTSDELEWLTLNDIIQAAHRNLSPELWDYLSGGAESETTLRRNRLAFERIAFRPRRLRDVLGRTTAISFLGRDLKCPVMLAPVGSIAKYHPDGALACARVAERLGTVAFVSSLAFPAIEQVRSGTNGILVLQLYIRGDRGWIDEQLRRAEAAECAGVCLTIDLVERGHRERNIRNRFGGSRGSGITAGPGDLDTVIRAQEALTWADLEWIKSRTNLPIIVKGIVCREDAELAVSCGADVIYVSNHGGRQLDHMQSTIEVLPEVIGAVGDAAEVVVDSGFVRGSDVLKALAMGARAVVVGKLMAWGLAAGGERGLQSAIELLRAEIVDLMAHLGVRTIEELTPDWIVSTFAPSETGWIGFATGGEPGNAL